MTFVTDNDHISTSVISHGLTWGSHRYIRREGTPGNYRYFYKEDMKPSDPLKKGATAIVSSMKSQNPEMFRGSIRTPAQIASRVATGAKNLASKAGTSVGRAIGVQQRQTYQRAETERKKWSDRFHADKKFGGIYAHDYKGGFENEAPYRQPSAYVTKNLNRAYEVSNRARKEYEKTPLGKAEKAADALKDMPSDVSYDVGQFLKSKVGVGYRDKINKSSGRYDKAWRTLETTEHNYYAAGNAVSFEQLQSARREFDDAWTDYHKSVQDYGKTFLGSIEKLLNTSYSKSVFIRHTPDNYKNLIPETVLKETIIPETKINETKIKETKIY